MFLDKFEVVRIGQDVCTCKHLFHNRGITANWNALIPVIEIVVVVSKPQRQPLDDERRQVGAASAPLLFGIALNQLFINIGANQRESLFFQVLWFCDVQSCNLLCNVFLCFLRCPNVPHLAKGVHIERQVVQFVLIDGNRRVDVVVELCELVDVVPNFLIGGMEDMCTILVYMDVLDGFAVDITSDVVSPFNHQAGLSPLHGFISEHCTEQASTNNQIIVFFHEKILLLRCFYR